MGIGTDRKIPEKELPVVRNDQPRSGRPGDFEMKLHPSLEFISLKGLGQKVAGPRSVPLKEVFDLVLGREQ